MVRRVLIGALFALALYLALKSSLIEFLKDAAHTVYFYATIAFISGFSERRAKVLLDSVGGGAPDASADGKGGATATRGSRGRRRRRPAAARMRTETWPSTPTCRSQPAGRRAAASR